MKFEHKKLNNGLNIVAEVNKDSQSAAIGFFAKTGSRDETDNINGVSHFLEHMLFKGTDELSALDVNLSFDNLGALYNAFTSEENTVYFAATLPEQFAEVTKLWCHLMRPALRDDDFNMEKNVILEEIAMYKDLPHYDILESCRALHFDKHPCAKSVLGSVDSIKALTSKQMREYFDRRYAPDNITAVLAGNFDFEKICDLIEAGCGEWQPRQTIRKIEYFAGTAKKESQKKSNLNRLHICIASPTVSYQDKRCYAAMLLAKIIGDDSGSRFFWALVDTAIAETATMQCEAMDGVGAYYSYISTDAKNSEKVMQIVEGIFKSLQKDKISEKELQAAKNKVLSAITIKNEVPMGRLVELGFNWVYLGKYRPIEDEIQKIKDVSIDDLTALLADFPLMQYTQFSLGPEK
jgi:predicted Zn-dependent peptidase